MKQGNPGFCTTFFSALSNQLRIRMLQALSSGPMTVSQLSGKLGAERTLVSHNLAMLSKAELVRCAKAGKTRVYSANEQVVPHVFFLMERVVCSRCSIRRTCIGLRERAQPEMPKAERPPCAGCRS